MRKQLRFIGLQVESLDLMVYSPLAAIFFVLVYMTARDSQPIIGDLSAGAAVICLILTGIGYQSVTGERQLRKHTNSQLRTHRSIVMDALVAWAVSTPDFLPDIIPQLDTIAASRASREERSLAIDIRQHLLQHDSQMEAEIARGFLQKLAALYLP